MIQPEAFEALASSTNGITKLRELILELAVRGLLVPQDLNDEPASELLKRINFNDQVKKDSIHPTYSNSIVEIQLPTGWEYVKLEQIANVGTGTTPSRGKPEYFLPPSIPWVTSGETSAPFIKHTAERISELALKETSLKIYPIGTLIMAMYGQGKTRGQISELTIEATTNQACAAIVLKLKDEWHRRYIKLHFQKQYDEIREASAGGAQPNLNVGKVKSTLISLPPIEEQRRIVTKVDELMALCNQLEQRQNHSNTVHQRLLQTLLESLTQAVDNEAFQKIWSQIAAHFDTLFTNEASIDHLKRVILQLAVMGKLVPQDPNDEPILDTLKKACSEKLVGIGKTRNEKQIPPIANGEIPYQLPTNWAWFRLDALSVKITDGEHLSPNKTSSGMLLLTAKHILEDGVTLNDPQYVSHEDGLRFRERCDPKTGDLLICSRGTIGRCCVMSLDSVFCLMGSVILVRPLPNVVPQYLNYFLKSTAGQIFIRGVTKGMAVNALYLKDIRLCPIPLPPLAEQHRIVARVDELMAICDLLKSRINKSQQTQEHLAIAIVEKAVA
jgi:type I restriction enzyme S subunit